MCNCQKVIEQKMTERLVALKPNATDHEVKLKGYTLTIGKTMAIRAYMPYEETMVITAKNGNKRKVKKTGSMFFSYCPFCGEKLAA